MILYFLLCYSKKMIFTDFTLFTLLFNPSSATIFNNSLYEEALQDNFYIYYINKIDIYIKIILH